MRGRVAGLSRELADVFDQRLIRRDQHAAARGGDDLVAIEGEDAGPAAGPRRLPIQAVAGLRPTRRPPVRRAQRLGRILDDGDVVAAADIQNRVEVGALAVEMHRDDGFGQPPLPRLALDGLDHQRRVQVPGGLLAVNEDWPGAQVDDRVGAGGEGEGGDQHLVAGADAGMDQGQVQRGRAGGERQRVGRADGGGELGLEGVHLRPQRRDPVGRAGFLDVPLFQVGHVGRGEVATG